MKISCTGSNFYISHSYLGACNAIKKVIMLTGKAEEKKEEKKEKKSKKESDDEEDEEEDEEKEDEDEDEESDEEEVILVKF